MKEKKELFSEKMVARSRSYFFDIKEAENGAMYLVISESRREADKYKHNRIMVFEEDIPTFGNALRKTLEQLKSLGRAGRGANDEKRQETTI